MMDEKEREKIRKGAKSIMDKFAKILDSVKDKVEDSFVEREQDKREEGEGKESSPEFKKIIFENAPNKNGNYFLGEKKKWE